MVYGWLFQFGLWHRVCDGPNMGVCARKLGRIAREKGVRQNLRMGLTGGSVPSWRPEEEGKGEATIAEVENP